MKVGLIACGYTASYFAQLLTPSHTLWASSRQPDALRESLPDSVEVIATEKAALSAAIADSDALLISAPPLPDGRDPILAEIRTSLLQHQNKLRWIAYLSSTGVYGDHAGDWVDENSVCQPSTEQAKNRLAAETAWRELYEQAAKPVVIFRLAGIYGPGRNSIERIQKGKRTCVYKAGQFFSRIHVFDICQALLESLKAPEAGEIYNLADDLPCNSVEVDRFAAELAGVEPPTLLPFEQAELSDMARHFYQSNRRVSNAKVKSQLLSALRYPTYKEGLAAILRGDTLR